MWSPLFVPGTIFAPFFLVFCLVMVIGFEATVWHADLIMCAPYLAVLLGKSMCLFSKSIKSMHSRGEMNFDPKTAWMEVIQLGLCGASVVLFVGALAGVIQLILSPTSHFLIFQLRLLVGLHLILALVVAYSPGWFSPVSSND